MGPLEQDSWKVHPTSLPGDEGFPSASSVPATLHSPPSVRLLRGSDLVTDTQARQLAHSCAVGSRRRLTRGLNNSPLLSAAPPLMILATTMAPVALSLLTVAPWSFDQSKEEKMSRWNRVIRMNSQNKMLTLGSDKFTRSCHGRSDYEAAQDLVHFHVESSAESSVLCSGHDCAGRASSAAEHNQHHAGV